MAETLAKQTEVNWMIGGPQGTGVDSSATLFIRSMAAAGYWVFGKREYHSNIKGKHSYFQVRVKHDPVQSNVDPIDMLATFDQETAETHAHEILANGALIYDPKITDPVKLPGLDASVICIPVEYDALIQELAEETGTNAMKLVIMKNTLAVGASFALYDLPVQAIETALKGLFTGKKAKLVESNMKAAVKAYNVVKAHADCGKFQYPLASNPNPPSENTRMVMNGATACGLGKIKAGCRILTYYSITPAVDECIFLEGQPEYGITVVQCEDELAAINMANGAGTTGIRASTATSGPGFSLMAEGIGWAGISEIPVVIFDYQRGGPSTGLPTRSEQSDLMYALNCGHGEFPRIVLAPGDMQECFEDGFYSFNYADRYQTPVIVMPDKAIANSTQTITPLDEQGFVIDRGELVDHQVKDPLNNPTEAIKSYPRYKITESGISPRVVPGTAGAIFWMTGDEHTEIGHITEDPAIRVPMHEKRMKKLDLALREIPQDRQFKVYGDADKAEVLLVGWGSTKGAVLDAISYLKAEHDVNMAYLHVRLFSPFPKAPILNLLKKAKRVVSIESNFNNQLAQVITMHTGFEFSHKVAKYTGRPISQSEVVDAVLNVVRNETEKVVLTYGH